MNRQPLLALLIAAFAACCIFSHSCANTTTPPGGGPKDTIPPVLIKITPEDNHLNFPLTGGQVVLQFDEYTIVKTATEIFLSPPTRKKPKTRIKGRNIVVMLQDTLMPSTTYTLDFGQGLADNNEGNVAPRVVYTFSTGDVIDSLFVTGEVRDCQSLQPEKHAFVALYSDLGDSACYNKVPDAAAFTDEWGFFTIRGLKARPYRMYAYTDADNDFKYNPDGDKIAFLDSVLTPSHVVDTSIYELGAFDMKDTLSCTHREPMYRLNIFSELQSIQYMQNAGRLMEKVGFVKFSAGETVVNSFSFVSIDSTEILTQFNPARDSMTFWITSRYNLPDSLIMRLNYLKTDSTGVLVASDTTIALGMPSDTVLLAANEARKKDTSFAFKVEMTNETVETDGIVISTKVPVLSMCLDSVRLVETNPKNQEADKQYEFRRDADDMLRFTFLPKEQFRSGYDYKLFIPKGAFTDMYGLPNNEETVKIAIPQGEELSRLSIRITGANTRYIVELTDEKQTQALRKFYADCDTTLLCPYLKAGKYAIRVTEDRNRNGIFDMGNLLAHRQPERVLVYETEPGKSILDIPERSELVQEIDLIQMFK